MSDGLLNGWNIAALTGLGIGVALWTLPLMGSAGQRLAASDNWAKAQLTFYFAAGFFAIAYALFAS